jgi:hypothetical protein
MHSNRFDGRYLTCYHLAIDADARFGDLVVFAFVARVGGKLLKRRAKEAAL